MNFKQGLLLLAFVPCALAVAAKPNWQELQFGKRTDTYDLANISVENDLATFWVLNTADQPGMLKGSQKIKFGIDCQKNLMSMLGFITYSNAPARGEIVSRRDTPSKTHVNGQIHPNTPGMEMRDYFCAKARRAP